jgi:hypothetical protein
MATFGDLRLQLARRFPGADLDLLDSYLVAGYNEILDRTNWQRSEAEYVLQTTSQVQGSATVTVGSNAVVGVGTTWDATMSGRMIRFGADPEYYGFTYVDATHATLDRNYSGSSGTVGFLLNQNVYVLPSEAREVEQVAFMNCWWQAERTTLQKLNQIDPGRNTYSDIVAHWAPYMDEQTSPPTPQIELWPVPTVQRTATVLYWVDNQVSLPLSASVAILAWVVPQAVVELAAEIFYRDGGKLPQAQAARTAAERYIQDMLLRDALQTGPVQLQGDDHYSRRNQQRSMQQATRGLYVGRILGA